MVTSRNRVWALIALAIISHESDTSPTAAECWSVAQLAAQQCFQFWSLEYVESIILYSLADLTVNNSDAIKTIKKADSKYYGRQMYFTGIGTVWPDILCMRAYRAKRILALSNPSLHAQIPHTSSISLGWHPTCCEALPEIHYPAN